ncbi:MAG: class I SAM-dependent methyltransferase [Candidatus Zambryskibacteria bacterium]|nr:class I SAM-dependent methyltransferase [Candidatus Zambryskibacteria bacterium]
MKGRTSISTSVRRYFIDEFFFSKSSLIKGKVVDIGGKKKNKRGSFDIDKLGVEVIYVNIEKRDEPDILADAATIPLPDNSYDVAIAAELLEHVPDPLKVLKEARRLLRPGGIVLATVPFMYPLHADPFDFGRYTDHFWKKAAQDLDFKIEIESQGTIFAVMALMIQHIFLAKEVSWRPIQIPLIKILLWLDKKTTNKTLRAWTTGYGIVLKK